MEMPQIGQPYIVIGGGSFGGGSRCRDGRQCQRPDVEEEHDVLGDQQAIQKLCLGTVSIRLTTKKRERGNYIVGGKPVPFIRQWFFISSRLFLSSLQQLCVVSPPPKPCHKDT
jgi:hypothetical protein